MKGFRLSKLATITGAACLLTIVALGTLYYGALCSTKYVADTGNNAVTNDKHIAGLSSTSTFKLFAPAWRGLGGAENKPNLPNFTEIFTNASPNDISGTAANTRFYNYTLGPYVVPRQVPCELIPTDWTQNYSGCGKEVTKWGFGPSGVARAYRNPPFNPPVASVANKFANILVVPDDAKTISFMKGEAQSSVTGSFSSMSGILSDSMGQAPLTGGYLNGAPIKPGTTRAYTLTEWLNAQKTMLQAKQSAIGSKMLIINGLANGDVYFQADSGSRELLTSVVDGAMAERIFREPHAAMGSWDGIPSWKNDVEMIKSVQSKGILGYWWTKCWAGSSNCQAEPGAEAGIKQIRRFAMASFMLGAGDKSFFNFDTKMSDGNAAEWFSDYAVAQKLGLATDDYAQIGSSGIYKRSYTNGIVLVNPDTAAHTANIGSARYKDLDGVVKTGSITLPAHTGSLLTTTTGGGSDVIAPTVSRTAPAAGATVSGSITVKGSATDNVAVTKVDLLIDGSVKGNDTNLPDVAINWDTKNVSDGNHTLALKAYDAAGNSSVTPTITITVKNTSTPPAPVINSLQANPSTVYTGSHSTISWTTTNVTTCTITPDGPINTTRTTWVTPQLNTVGTKTYQLDCVNAAEVHVKKSVSITVQAPTMPPAKPILSASATAIKSGDSVTLSWSSTGATSCTLSPLNISSIGGSGSRVIADLRATTTYSVKCSNIAGSTASDSVTVTVSSNPPPPADPVITSFVATPDKITAGQQSELTWAASNVRAGGCRLVPSALTSANANGSWLTPPLTSSTTYTLTCLNTPGKATSRSVSVVVDGVPAPSAPEPVAPTTDPNEDDQTITDGVTKTPVDNAEELTTVNGWVTLDPSNIGDEERIAMIEKVEYYIGENMIQSRTTRPFALDTTKLANGRYTITERTYFKDGSVSEVTRTIDIDNAAFSNSSGGIIGGRPVWQWVLLGSLVALLVVAFIFRHKLVGLVGKLRRQPVLSENESVMFPEEIPQADIAAPSITPVDTISYNTIPAEDTLATVEPAEGSPQTYDDTPTVSYPSPEQITQPPVEDEEMPEPAFQQPVSPQPSAAPVSSQPTYPAELQHDIPTPSLDDGLPDVTIEDDGEMKINHHKK